MKFEIRVPNSVREALLLDMENKNNLWAKAIIKEMEALDNVGFFKYKPPNFNVLIDYQCTPVRIIFEIKHKKTREEK